MLRRIWALPVLSVLLIAACGGGGEETQVYRTDSGLAFKVPLDVQASNPQSTVAGPALLTGPGFQVTFNHASGAPRPASGASDVRISLLSVDGHNGHAEFYTDPGSSTGLPFVASLYVADAGGGMSLAMVVRSADETGHDRAKKIFKSMEFGDVSVRDTSQAQ